MHIYEGGDSSAMQEHLEQIHTKGQEKSNVTFWLVSPQLLAVCGFYQSRMQRAPLALFGNEL